MHFFYRKGRKVNMGLGFSSKEVFLLLRREKVAFEGAFIVSASVISEAIQNKKVASTYSPTRTSVACEEEE